ncbi:PREDICTED: slit homolog 1 protein-like isoform X2 [Priapulus caudatus]|nr:PREDICTED: slit homolog 1 protein-like isoform X2 [Priapulus caudatus]
MWTAVSAVPRRAAEVYLNPAFDFKISRDAFAGWTITKLYVGGFGETLGGGTVRAFEDGALEGLGLKQLDLSLNKLQSIGRDTFSGLRGSQLVFLNLEGNAIENIELDAFRGIPLEGINLRRNRIQRIARGIFEDVPKERLLLEGNPLYCDCCLGALVSAPVGGSEVPPSEIDGACAAPLNLAGRAIDSLKQDELHCDKNSLCLREGIATTVAQRLTPPTTLPSTVTPTPSPKLSPTMPPTSMSTQPLGSWSSWTYDSSCSNRCGGGGTTTRRRTCQPPSAACKGQQKEETACNRPCVVSGRKRKPCHIIKQNGKIKKLKHCQTWCRSGYAYSQQTGTCIAIF